jgi:hypothetical protein
VARTGRIHEMLKLSPYVDFNPMRAAITKEEAI